VERQNSLWNLLFVRPVFAEYLLIPAQRASLAELDALFASL
jgi:hypothetical protein